MYRTNYKKNTFKFIFGTLKENKEKIFRWKLIHRVLPNNILLSQWKIVNDKKCNTCKTDEDYQHYFIDCKYFSNLWNFTKPLFEILKITKEMKTLKHIVVGYKIGNKRFNSVNIILSLIAFTIYKSYHLSDRKLKQINVISLFKCEFRKKMSIGYYKNNNDMKKLNAYMNC